MNEIVHEMPECLLSHFSHVRFFATPWTVARQGPLSLGFSRQEHCSGLPCPPPGDLPNPGIALSSKRGSCAGRQVFHHERHLGSPSFEASGPGPFSSTHTLADRLDPLPGRSLKAFMGNWLYSFISPHGRKAQCYIESQGFLSCPEKQLRRANKTE